MSDEIVEILIIGATPHSWYRNSINKKVKVYANMVKHYDDKLVYQSIDDIGIINPEHALTTKQQLIRKINRVI